jgi:hypothetical protein
MDTGCRVPGDPCVDQTVAGYRPPARPGPRGTGPPARNHHAISSPRTVRSALTRRNGGTVNSPGARPCGWWRPAPSASNSCSAARWQGRETAAARPAAAARTAIEHSRRAARHKCNVHRHELRNARAHCRHPLSVQARCPGANHCTVTQSRSTFPHSSPPGVKCASSGRPGRASGGREPDHGPATQEPGAAAVYRVYSCSGSGVFTPSAATASVHSDRHGGCRSTRPLRNVPRTAIVPYTCRIDDVGDSPAARGPIPYGVPVGKRLFLIYPGFDRPNDGADASTGLSRRRLRRDAGPIQ